MNTIKIPVSPEMRRFNAAIYSADLALGMRGDRLDPWQLIVVLLEFGLSLTAAELSDAAKAVGYELGDQATDWPAMPEIEPLPALAPIPELPEHARKRLMAKVAEVFPKLDCVGGEGGKVSLPTVNPEDLRRLR